MPSPGLSLVGFLDESQGIEHLRTACAVADTRDASLSAEWNAAKNKLGNPIAKAGYPDIQPLSAEGVAHMDSLVKQPWVQAAFGASPGLPGAGFHLVEIDPLLAFQFTVDTKRAAHHNGGVEAPPTDAELLTICLPMAQAIEQVQVHQSNGSIMVTARSLNFRSLAQGFMNNQFLGVHVGLSLPFVHVVRLNGRCYLHNGFHRAVGLRARGVTHVPCMLREVADHQAVGVNPPGTFDANLLDSDNPPTLAHFTQGRAYEVSLKAFHRVVHISWAEYVTTQE